LFIYRPFSLIFRLSEILSEQISNLGVVAEHANGVFYSQLGPFSGLFAWLGVVAPYRKYDSASRCRDKTVPRTVLLIQKKIAENGSALSMACFGQEVPTYLVASIFPCPSIRVMKMT
jgi:hypothetical protein